VARSIAAISLVVGAVTIASPRAHAQNAAAEALFNDGERLMKEGKLAEACEAFEGSNRIEMRAGTLINLGMCREKNGQLASAWSAFKDALTRVQDPKKRQVAQERIAAIEPKLSYLTISVPDESRVDGLAVTRNTVLVDPALWNRAVPVDGATYVITGRAPGHEEWSTTVQVPNESGKVSVEVPRFKELAKLVTPPTPPQPEGEEEEVAETPSQGMFTTKRKVAIGVGAVGVAAIGAGVFFGLQAKGFEDDAFALCPNPMTPCADGNRANDLIKKGESRAMLANITLGVGAAAVIGAGVLWFLGAPVESGNVAVMPRTNGLDVMVRF
jgi:hypothetical protein